MRNPTVVIGTAGHIDHGKTALLRALTGIDADRLPEERARGMTIDVGYAHLAFEDGVELDFVDVPGHDRLIGNMLVGAGEIDAALLVVAADDGPRPQTREHLELLDALGIADAVVAVTRIDLVDAERVAFVADEVHDLLRPTLLAWAPVVPVSSVSGAGIEDLRGVLRRLIDAVRPRFAQQAAADVSGVRLAIDRVFSAKGRGIVVTGSLRGGALRVGDTLRVEPGGEAVRVRALQVHGSARDVHAGGRTALNLAGAVEGLARGKVLTTSADVRGTDRVLVGWTADVSSAARRTRPSHGREIRLHIGTDQVGARMRHVRGVDEVVLLDLDAPTATFAGDRGVARDPGSGAIWGGIRVLDPRPRRGVSRRRLTPERVRLLARAVEAGDPEAIRAARIDLHGLLETGGGVALAADVRAALEQAAIELVVEHHREAPMSAGLPLPRARAALLRHLRSMATVQRADAAAAATSLDGLLDRLVREGRLERVGEALRDPARERGAPAELVAAMRRLEDALSVPAPPPLAAAAGDAGCPPEGVRALAAEGRIVRLGPDLAWSSREYHRLAAVALELARARALTPAAFRDVTGTSRKYVLAILEDLDRRGILQRTPEGHIPGPRAPRPSSSPPQAVR